MSSTPIKRPALIGLEEVKKITGLSRSTIYRSINEGYFPAQVNIGQRRTMWIEQEIFTWIKNRIDSRLKNYNELVTKGYKFEISSNAYEKTCKKKNDSPMTEQEFLVQIEKDLAKCKKTIHKYTKNIPGDAEVPNSAIIRNICFTHTHLIRKLTQPEMEVF